MNHVNCQIKKKTSRAQTKKRPIRIFRISNARTKTSVRTQLRWPRSVLLSQRRAMPKLHAAKNTRTHTSARASQELWSCRRQKSIRIARHRLWKHDFVFVRNPCSKLPVFHLNFGLFELTSSSFNVKVRHIKKKT